jgi:hypothetical protein
MKQEPVCMKRGPPCVVPGLLDSSVLLSNSLASSILVGNPSQARSEVRQTDEVFFLEGNLCAEEKVCQEEMAGPWFVCVHQGLNPTTTKCPCSIHSEVLCWLPHLSPFGKSISEFSLGSQPCLFWRFHPGF